MFLMSTIQLEVFYDMEGKENFVGPQFRYLGSANELIPAIISQKNNFQPDFTGCRVLPTRTAHPNTQYCSALKLHRLGSDGRR